MFDGTTFWIDSGTCIFHVFSCFVMFFLFSFFHGIPSFLDAFFLDSGRPQPPKSMLFLSKSMVFKKSEVSQKYGFYHHFWSPKVDPGLENVVKRPCFVICFFMFFYMKNLIL